jgi:hypothetical protein
MFSTGLTRVGKAEQNSLVPARQAQRTHQGRTQKRFIHRLLTRHGCLPVWLVADK